MAEGSEQMSNIVKDVVAVNAFNPFKPFDSSFGSSGKRKRAPSEVWQHFTKVPNEHGVPEKCICHHCDSIFSCKPVNGTSHLQRHLDRCAGVKKEQSQQFPDSLESPEEVKGQFQQFANSIKNDVLDDQFQQFPDAMKGLQGEGQFQQLTPMRDFEENGSSSSRSKVWQHFTKFISESGIPDKCECHHCGAKLSCKAANGTSHLQRHLQHSCPGFRKTFHATALIPISNKGTTEHCRNSKAWKFDQDRSKRDLATVVILNELPLRIVESQDFRTFINNLQPQFEMISQNTMKEECMQIYESEKLKLKETMKNLSQRVCITIDTWTSLQMLKYVSATIRFIDTDWKLQRKLISVSQVKSTDSANILGEVIVNRLPEWDLKKLFTITVDNILVKDFSLRYLGDYFSTHGIPSLNGELSRICCWARIIDLVVQNGLDAILDFVSKIRECVKYAKGSARQQADFLKCLKIEKISESKRLHLDNPTRWDSTYEMLTSAVHYKEAFCRMKSYELIGTIPSTDDWMTAAVLCEFLEVFYTAAKVISAPNYLTSNCFFHEIFGLKIALREMSISSDPILCKMSSKMCEVFDEYWEDKERNLLLEVAVVLDPRYKLDYLRFCLQKVYSYGEVEAYMYRINSLLHTLYNQYVLTCQLSSDVSEGSSSNKVVDMKTLITSGVKKQSMFRKEFLKFKKEESSTADKLELDVYLQEYVYNCGGNEDDEVLETCDILAWWKENSHRFRILSQLARDVLAIPVSTISQGVLDRHLSSLKPSILEALMCSRDWLRKDGTAFLEGDYDIVDMQQEGLL